MRITVLTGGTSSERDVAIASAVQVVAALRSRNHDVRVVDTAKGYVPPLEEASLLHASVGLTPPSLESLAALERGLLVSGLGNLPVVRDADVVFLALHGGWGEDGTIQSILDVIGVPYTGSGPLGSALALDKDISKRLFQQAGVPTPDWLMAPQPAHVVGQRLGWPVVVKPSHEGSTVGLSVVQGPEELLTAVETASVYDAEVLIESFVPGRELTVGVLADQALAVGEIVPQHEIFDYECKYTPGMSEETFPADVPPRIVESCQQLAVTAHRALKLGGYSRVDFRLTAQGQPLCLEVNTLPGLTSTSLLPQSALASGIDFAELCDRICAAGVTRGV
jgi:D-alanine-D-alanine ligase